MEIENSKKLTYYRINDKGEREEVDTFTGDIISTKSELELLDTKMKKYPYSPGVGMIIANYIREGETIHSLSKKQGFPPAAVMYRWRDENEDFKNALKNAEVDRGDERYHQIMERIDTIDTLDKNDVPKEKLVIDTLKWAAEKDNPEKYGNKTKVVGEGIGTTIIQVVTGIDRDGTIEGAIPAEYKQVLEKEYENGQTESFGSSEESSGVSEEN